MFFYLGPQKSGLNNFFYLGPQKSGLNNCFYLGPQKSGLNNLFFGPKRHSLKKHPRECVQLVNLVGFQLYFGLEKATCVKWLQKKQRNGSYVFVFSGTIPMAPIEAKARELQKSPCRSWISLAGKIDPWPEMKINGSHLNQDSPNLCFSCKPKKDTRSSSREVGRRVPDAFLMLFFYFSRVELSQPKKTRKCWGPSS